MLVSAVANASESATDTLSRINLPLLTIETINNEMPICEYVEHPAGCWGATIRNATKVPGRLQISQLGKLLYDSGKYDKNKSGITIKIRGNTSAYYSEKKPYKIKLQQEADLLHRGNDLNFSDKEWILIKDINLMYMTGFKINQLLQMPWTPACEYVNVVINGEYMGVYLLTEAVSRNSNCRIDVDETGYLFEYDAYWWNEPVYVKSEIRDVPMHYTFKFPDADDLTTSQLDYFSQMIHQTEQSVINGTYPDYIDIESFARWMLGHDIIGNSDGGGANYILTKYDNTSNSKIQMACLWDFDGDYRNENKWDGCHNSFYFNSLFNNKNNDFVNRYKAVYEEISSTIFDDIINYLENFASSDIAEALSTSIVLDNQKYGTTYLDVNNSVNLAKSWFLKRQVWLNDSIPAINSSYLNIDVAKTVTPSIYACGNKIVVENATDEIRVYDAMGRLVGKDAPRNVFTETTAITIKSTGVYIVKTGTMVKRVAITN
ncbi:MAG: CotH kinase family protein [Salinivirgaceae bacterium]|nr:CotH kinase family protein [Salinivirgaceae bacterium]